MLDIIFITMIFYVLQLVLPTLIAVARKEVDNAFLFGPRDTQPEVSQVVQRARRNANNFLESLLIFMPLAVLATVNDAAAAEAATIWLGLRVAYTISYLMGLSYVRTLIWFASLAALYMMGATLV